MYSFMGMLEVLCLPTVPMGPHYRPDLTDSYPTLQGIQGAKGTFLHPPLLRVCSLKLVRYIEKNVFQLLLNSAELHVEVNSKSGYSGQTAVRLGYGLLHILLALSFKIFLGGQCHW